MTTGELSGNNYGRQQAWQLLTQWTESESLRKHALAVEACVVAYGEQEATRLGLQGDARDAFRHIQQRSKTYCRWKRVPYIHPCSCCLGA